MILLNYVLCIKWHTEFSYCVLNFQGVKIFDVIAKQRITNVPRDDISLRPDMYPCSLCWKDNLTLIIGWGNSVKVQLPVFVINACCYHRQTEDYFWKAKAIGREKKKGIWFDYCVENSCCHRNVIGLTFIRRNNDKCLVVRQISLSVWVVKTGMIFVFQQCAMKAAKRVLGFINCLVWKGTT